MPEMKDNHSKIDWQLINLSEVARRLNVSQSYLYVVVTGRKRGVKAVKLLRRAEEAVQHWIAA